MQAKTLRKKTVEELVALNDELKKRLYVVRLQTALSQNEFTHKISGLRKDIARVLTILKEKKASESKIYDLTQKVRVSDLKKAIDAEQSLNEKLGAKKQQEKDKKAAENDIEKDNDSKSDSKIATKVDKVIKKAVKSEKVDKAISANQESKITKNNPAKKAVK